MDREVRKPSVELESDNAALSHLFQLIPGFTKKMNSRIKRREIPMEASACARTAVRALADSRVPLWKGAWGG